MVVDMEEEVVVEEEEVEEAGVEVEEVVDVGADVVTEEEDQVVAVVVDEVATTGNILKIRAFFFFQALLHKISLLLIGSFLVFNFHLTEIIMSYLLHCVVSLLQTKHETRAKRSSILRSLLIHLGSNKPFISKPSVHLMLLNRMFCIEKHCIDC